MRKTLKSISPDTPVSSAVSPETESQEVAGTESSSPQPSPQGCEGEKRGCDGERKEVTGEVQAGGGENKAGRSPRPQPIAEKLWHGVRVLSQQGSFEIRDLCVICNNASYVYARKFLMYLYLKGIVTRQMKGHSRDWRHVLYTLAEGAERPEPVFMSPSIYKRMVEAEGGTVPDINIKSVPPQPATTSGAEEAAPSTAAPDGNPAQQNVDAFPMGPPSPPFHCLCTDQGAINECGTRTGKSSRKRLPAQSEESAPTEESAPAEPEAGQDQSAGQSPPPGLLCHKGSLPQGEGAFTALSNDVQDNREAAIAAEARKRFPDCFPDSHSQEEEKVKHIRLILDGFYEDCINKIQWLNLAIHKVRGDSKKKYMEEAFLLLEAVQVSIKLYYNKLLQASEDVDLSAVFAKDAVPEELLSALEANLYSGVRYGDGK